MDGDDLELFERSLRHATETTSGVALDAALAGLGWHEALADDRRTAVSLLFELQGRAGATSSSLDAVLAGALGAAGPGVAVVLPALGGTDPPGTAAGDDVTVRGVATAAVSRAERAVVALPDRVVAVAVADLQLRPVAGLDPRAGLVTVVGDGVRASSASPASPSVEVGADWSRALADGRLALASELVGASRAILELARTHALERVQFDRPIAGFQAVRHRLADAYVAIEAAADATGAAWEDGSPLAASAAKAIAGRSARLVAKHGQQVLAGIGFTTEHPLHLYVRRVLLLDRLLGDSRLLTRQLGAELLRTRRAPAMLPL